MHDLLKNPLTLWLQWYFRSRWILLNNRNKNLKIGYLTDLFNVRLGNYNTFHPNISVSNSKIDDYVYVAQGSKIINATIGKFCSIGQNVQINLGMHPTNFISTFPSFFSTGKQCQITFTDIDLYKEMGNVNIGNDVWIGANVIIMGNLTIGNGSIIAAGAVVTKNVEPYSIVGGVPAKLIKKRFTDVQIKQLMEYKWWEKDITWIRKNSDSFNNSDRFFEIFNTIK